jgi:hypothetical protein
MDSLRRTVKTVLALMVVWSFSFPPGAGQAGDTLTAIKAQGKLRCGVSDGIQGFSLRGCLKIAKKVFDNWTSFLHFVIPARSWPESSHTSSWIPARSMPE